jgi:hypothetical protein
MRKILSTLIVACGAALVCAPTQAQAPAAPPAAGGTADGIPFDIPYGTPYNAYETGHPYVATLDPTLIASPGGWPLIQDGKLVGAIGCSGGTGDQDAAACKAGADLVK